MIAITNISQVQSSFLETNSEVSSLLTNMMMLTGARKRYTKIGPCASAFVVDNQTHTDCVINVTPPGGGDATKEWCYLDSSWPVEGNKNWDYCIPIMDYDKVRLANQMEMLEIIKSLRQLENEISNVLLPGQQALADLKRVKNGQAEIDSKIATLLQAMGTLGINIKNLYDLKEQWTKEEQKAVEAASIRDKKLSELSEAEKNSLTVLMDTSEETLRKEIDSDKCAINPFIQEKVIDPSFSCSGKLLYEDDSTGDGLLGQYYDNERLEGQPREQIDPVIDFEWTGSSPISGINSTNFSVRWEGFIYAPFTGQYKFTVECDGGAILTINNIPTLSHRFYIFKQESRERVDSWLKEETERRTNPSKNYNKSISPNEIRLTGGTKYKVVLLYTHSIFADVLEDDKSFIKLYWSSNEFDEMLIPKSYLYSHHTLSPLKISGFTNETAVIRKLLENDLAYKNSDKYVLQDVPEIYRGSHCLKLNTKFMDNELKFELNMPAYVYIGKLYHYPNPIPLEFENTNEFMTLLQIEKPGPNNQSGVINAERSAIIEIYKKRYDKGHISIPLDKTKGINVKGMPLIVFFTMDSSTGAGISCGGSEILLSSPGGDNKYFKTVAASSSAIGSKPEDAFKDPIIKWTSREGVNSWAEVKFTEMFEVTKLQFFNRIDPSERFKSIEVEFSNGTKRTFNNLPNSFTEKNIPVDPPVRTTSVRFTIKEVYGNRNIGGSFRVYGVKCIDPDDRGTTPSGGFLQGALGIPNHKDIKPLFNTKDDRIVSLLCNESLSNSMKLDYVKKKSGNKVVVYCNDSCTNTKFSIYGDEKYSKDSAICKAAAHSNKINPDSRRVEVVFDEGLPSYPAADKNGIMSQSKPRSDLTIVFNNIIEEDEIILNIGTKVDYQEPNSVGRNSYQSSIIKEIKGTTNKTLTLTLENNQQTIFNIPYPSKQILPCGTYLPNRDCSTSRRNPNLNQPIIINFIPRTHDGHLLITTTATNEKVDSGEIFGKALDRPYGWSRDMSGQIKLFNDGKKSIAYFNSDPKSNNCYPRPNGALCDKVTWTVKAGYGKFRVRIWVMDPTEVVRADIKVNDVHIVKIGEQESEKLRIGEEKIFEGIIESAYEYLTFSSECEKNCDKHRSRMNKVEISPHKDADDIKRENENKITGPEKQGVCGNGITGGKCDKGPDVTHCIFNTPIPETAKYCGQDNKTFLARSNKCKESLICVQWKYDNQATCEKFCPGTCDKTGQCTASS
jgi:hypothetical protein